MASLDKAESGGALLALDDRSHRSPPFSDPPAPPREPRHPGARIGATDTDPAKGLPRLEETELVRRAQADLYSAAGRAAISTLLGRYQEHVYSWCYHHLRDHERALEITQDVLLRAYRHLRGFEAQGCFGAWIFAIARNRCRSALRGPSWLRDDTIDLDALESRLPSPEDTEIQEEAVDLVMEAMEERLEPMEQEALWLRCAEGMPVEEITRALRIQERSGARAVLQRARRKLRAAIAARERRSQAWGQVWPCPSPSSASNAARRSSSFRAVDGIAGSIEVESRRSTVGS